RVGCAPVGIESFDRYTAAGATTTTERPQTAGRPPAALPRHVYLLFDVAFSSPRGLVGSSKTAGGYLEQLPATDRLYLLVNDRRTGLKQVLGPVAADEEGKEKVFKRIRELRPDVDGLETNAESKFPMSVRGTGRNGAPADQDSPIRDNIRATGRSQYQGAALGLAESLEVLAAELRRLPGPKLLVMFTQGLHPQLYFQGNSIGLQTGRQNHHMDSRQFSPLVSHFEKPLQALAESGAMSLFVNLDHQVAVAGLDADSALRHMASSTGGLYVEGGSPKQVEDRMAGSTAAYYEAGFLPAGSLLEAGRAGVEVAVHRPGVRVWAPSAVRTRESYGALSDHEKRLLAIDLVHGGPEVQRSRSPVRLDLRDLSGRVKGRVEPKQRLVRFEADWPTELAGKKVDLYTVVLSEPRHGKQIEVLLYDHREQTPVADLPALETAVDGHNAFVWGVVAVEPGTERAWFRRLFVQGEKPGGGQVRPAGQRE
ncbi:MAG TPA: hypothetical protein VE685_11175, partial [Thermoanaerobaculia bacterium]|nr:hypothetical protein [Thermoanaerobaculia bacterium]